MSTGSPFVPTPFSTSIVSPVVTSAFRRAPYISPSEYRSAPTAVGTSSLIPAGSAQQNTQALADVIMRASGWLDLHCFHTADGTLAASPSTESGRIKPKLDGSLVLICKYKPILEVLALALGSVPSQLTSLTTAPDLIPGEKTITLPATGLGAPSGDFPTFPMTTYNGRVYCVWSYVNGFPHTFLAETCAAGASSLVVAPSLPGGSSVYGVYPGTQLTIHDDAAGTEVIVVESVSGTTLNLASPTAYAHTVPSAPDSIRVSSVPWAVEQACISLTSCLIKTRGTGAAVLPMEPGAAPSKDTLLEAGGLEDYEIAVELLKPFTTVFMGNR